MKIAVVSYYPKYLEVHRQQLGDFDMIVAADSGAERLFNIGIIPDVCIGDFDSIDQSVLKQMPFCIPLPTQKDETDTHAALNYVYNRYPDAEVTVFVSMSGRSDQQFALLSLYYQFIINAYGLKFETEQGRIVMLRPGSYRFERKSERYVSCFAFQQDVENLTIVGARYPLDKASLHVGSDRGCSNEFSDEEIQIAFTSGILLVYFIESEVE